MLTNLVPGVEEFNCIYGKFNKDGILCSHILKVIIEQDVRQIPDKYIIDRWRKAENKINLKTLQPMPMTNELLRHNILSRQVAELTSKAAKKEEAMNYLVEEFKKVNIHLDMLLSSEAASSSSAVTGLDEPKENENLVNVDGLDDSSAIQDTLIIKKKGRPPNPKRFKTRVEVGGQKIEAAEQKKKTKKAETSSNSYPYFF